ncbi:pyruvate formate lyase-activating protein [Agromyces protaetiae]|uniref:Pyruvate formate-lyase-activating enzyme n=1 Tax=Agromyces protaetiae TaxID=2509455 RepID=A0A4P6FE13_9MICO|nr:pyruvate formate-lyase-activating protein [Agromyces protaetiae]QAY74372.1 pyruvate formate lyase-activating protein [Agromyces protaetiae]
MTIAQLPSTGARPDVSEPAPFAAPRPAADPLREARLAGLRSGELGSVHSWELVTAVDGPGTRMTLFLAGCPLRCVYCHNPDTWFARDGRITTVDEIAKKLDRYRRVFDATGGGLTISGGEALMQPAFVARLLEECRARDIHTTLDTSGFLGTAATDEMLDATDLVLLDVKSGLPDTYRAVTGAELQPTIDFGDRLSARGTKMWVRFVLVPGVTDAFDNVEAVADIVARWSTVERVEVLPFHQMGASKWEQLGREYTLEDVRAPDDALVERVRGQFRARGFEVY